MNPDVLTNEIIHRKKRTHRRNILFVMLALLVTAITAYSLLIPAFTQETITFALECTADIHQHTQDCYSQDGELICGYADYIIHKHNDLCYDNDGNLICTLPEIEEHSHSDACYTTIKTLICNINDENHIHDESCYKIENVLSCGKEELHSHTDECYDENHNLICGKTELKKHIHDAQCLKAVQEESIIDESSIQENSTENSVVPKLNAPLKAAAITSSTTYTIKNGGEPARVTGGTISISGTNKNKSNILTVTVTSLVSGTNYQNVINQINNSLSANSSLDNIYVYQITKILNSSNNQATITVEPDSNYAFYSDDVSGMSFITDGTPIIALYTTKQNDSQESSSESTDDTTLVTEQSDYTVTVKGNQNKLKDCKVFVEKIQPQNYQNYYTAMVQDIDSSLSTDISKKDSIFQFVNMYHIYLSKDNGATEYVLDENENINLQVTIKDSSFNAEQAYIGHYGKGAVKKDISDSNGLAVKQVKISNGSITFHLKSFSVITVAALQESQQAGTSSNAWQIVDGDNLTKYDYRDNVRIQKKVIPTGVENEFKIYLNVEPQVKNTEETTFIKETFQASGFLICNNNNAREANYTFDSNTSIKDIIKAFDLSENSGYSLLVDRNKTGDDYYTGSKKQQNVDTIIIKKSGGGEIKLSNVNMKIMINGNPKSLIFCLKDSGTSYKCPDGISYSGTTLTFNTNVYENLIKAGLFTESGQVTTKYKTVLATPTTVTDTMGGYIEYLELERVSGNGSVTQNDNTITWNMGTATKTEEETANGATYIKNAYELVYRIRLKTDQAGFVGDTPYLTNASTVLAGTGITDGTSFTSPLVKGKLPITNVVINMLKTADGNTNQPLANAEFTLQCIDGEHTSQYYKLNGVNTEWTSNAEYKIQSGGDGKFSVTVPNGTFILTETKAPDGYYTSDTWTIIVNGTEITFTPTSQTTESVTKDGNYYIISNKSGKVLPSTGGTGTHICIIGGVLILALTLLWRYFIRKKFDEVSDIS